MLIGNLLLFGPGLVFLATLPLTRRLRPALRRTYWVLGAIIVFAGSGTSYYLAAFTGDQGGIAAYFFQIAVILAYLLLSVSLIAASWLLSGAKSQPPAESPPSEYAQSQTLPVIRSLVDLLNNRFAGQWHYYGMPALPPEDSMAFTIDGINATFSVTTEGGRLPDNVLDVQVEGVPPGDYVYSDELSVAAIETLVDQFRKPEQEWPV